MTLANIAADFSTSVGTLKPLHGLNNGPINFGSMLDNRHRFRELGVPWVRLHDTNWPHQREVDMPQIFPDSVAGQNHLGKDQPVAASGAGRFKKPQTLTAIAIYEDNSGPIPSGNQIREKTASRYGLYVRQAGARELTYLGHVSDNTQMETCRGGKTQPFWGWNGRTGAPPQGSPPRADNPGLWDRIPLGFGTVKANESCVGGTPAATTSITDRVPAGDQCPVAKEDCAVRLQDCNRTAGMVFGLLHKGCR